MSAQKVCPICGEQSWGGKATRLVLDGLTHSVPSLWLAGNVQARDKAQPHLSALEHFRDAMEAWAEQCEARGQQ